MKSVIRAPNFLFCFVCFCFCFQCLRKWEEQHLKDLQQKAEKERRDRDEIKQQAREWIQRFYDDRTVRVRTQGEQNELSSLSFLLFF